MEVGLPVKEKRLAICVSCRSNPTASPTNNKTKLAEFNADYRVREEDLKHSCFHHSEKGCKTYSFGIRKCPNLTKDHKKCELCESFPRLKCSTHNLIVCQCGFEFGWHLREWSGIYKDEEIIIEDESLI